MSEESRLDRLEALAAQLLEGIKANQESIKANQESFQKSFQESIKATKDIVASNAHSIEALTTQMNEVARDRQEVYRLFADLASANARVATAQAEFYHRLAQTDKRQGEIVDILKLLTQKVTSAPNPDQAA